MSTREGAEAEHATGGAGAGGLSIGGAAGSAIVLAGGTAGSETDGGAAGFAGDGRDPLDNCENLSTWLTLTGDLPEGFGESVTLTEGWEHIRTVDYAWPFSYSVVPPENPVIEQRVAASSADDALRVSFTMIFQPSGRTGRASFDLNGTRVYDTSDVTFEEGELPFASWPYFYDESDGLGELFTGSLEIAGASEQGETITGRFSVCHVLNIPRR